MYKGIIYYIAISLVILVGYIKYIEVRGIYYPVKEIVFTPEMIRLSFEDIYIETKDKIKINGWFIPYPDAKYTIFFCHGNAGNIGDRLDKINLFYGLGLNLFIIDYRGYGRSQGSPSEKGIYSDAKAGYDYLVNVRKIRPEEIILYGESLGTAAAVDLASKEKIRALIIEGAFSRGRDMARKIYPFLPPFLFSNSFDSLTKIKELKAPKLFIHSKDDEIVPVALAKKLYNAALEPKYFIEISGGHNTAFLDSQEKFVASITSFIKQF